jgi:hypothetical protein
LRSAVTFTPSAARSLYSGVAYLGGKHLALVVCDIFVGALSAWASVAEHGLKTGTLLLLWLLLRLLLAPAPALAPAAVAAAAAVVVVVAAAAAAAAAAAVVVVAAAAAAAAAAAVVVVVAAAAAAAASAAAAAAGQDYSSPSSLSLSPALSPRQLLAEQNDSSQVSILEVLSRDRRRVCARRVGGGEMNY